MLILSRKPDEKVILNPGTDDEIEVTVLGVKGRQVRLGFSAPPDVDIVREELLQRDEKVFANGNK